MDPNEALMTALTAAHNLGNETGNWEVYDNLFNLVQWKANGGFDPDWLKAFEAMMPEVGGYRGE
jgi:hypothetical protein